MKRKGILLAGGRGKRLFPASNGINKHLMPVWDRPMLYHPLVSLILTGVEELLLITNPQDRDAMERMVGDGSQWGLKVDYALQEQPLGLAHGLILAEDYLHGSPCVMALGDNIFHGHGLPDLLKQAGEQEQGATVLAVVTDQPQNFGVVKLDSSGQPIEIVEKPKHSVSPWAVTGLYFYDGRASEMATKLQPSERGELEISDLNQAYLEDGSLQVVPLRSSVRWWDVGSAEAMLKAANFFQRQEAELGRKSLCPEEAAFRTGLLTLPQLQAAIQNLPPGSYRRHLELFSSSLPNK